MKKERELIHPNYLINFKLSRSYFPPLFYPSSSSHHDIPSTCATPRDQWNLPPPPRIESVKLRKVCNKLQGKERKKNRESQRSERSSSPFVECFIDFHDRSAHSSRLARPSGNTYFIRRCSGSTPLKNSIISTRSCVSVYARACITALTCGTPHVFGVINEERHSVACPYPHTYELTLSGAQFSTFLIFSRCVRTHRGIFVKDEFCRSCPLPSPPLLFLHAVVTGLPRFNGRFASVKSFRRIV